MTHKYSYIKICMLVELLTILFFGSLLLTIQLYKNIYLTHIAYELRIVIIGLYIEGLFIIFQWSDNNIFPSSLNNIKYGQNFSKTKMIDDAQIFLH